ncbi:hypothetical protein OH492_14795 [Vibrio chagasii]|nr:hypothetical protein [Vibrio chagasii]
MSNFSSAPSIAAENRHHLSSSNAFAEAACHDPRLIEKCPEELHLLSRSLLVLAQAIS